MSVARAKEFVRRLRAAGVTVHEIPGCYSRGNGQTSDYEGSVIHHTASDFANYVIDVLINGRSDLRGPLCNSAGLADGSVGLVSAHPANHAGASGGWDTAPLPRTTLFNKKVWGHEIIYPGTVRMTQAQYDTALIVAKVASDIWGYGDINRAKFHQGTSITGKWDPGYAPGKTYNINDFRRAARGAIGGGGGAAPGGDDDMPSPKDWDEEDKAAAYETMWRGAKGARLIDNRIPGMNDGWPEYFLGGMPQWIIEWNLKPMRAQIAELLKLQRAEGDASSEEIATALMAGLRTEFLPAMLESVRETLADADFDAELSDETKAGLANQISEGVLTKMAQRLPDPEGPTA